jgi:hypothetical protein
MDDDTSAVVFIAGVIIIAVIASYATYQWVVTTANDNVQFRFHQSHTGTVFPKDATVDVHNTMVMNVVPIIKRPKAYILSMGFGKS